MAFKIDILLIWYAVDFSIRKAMNKHEHWN